MNKLEKLYESIRTLEELSIPLNPETLKAVDELQEDIIKKENRRETVPLAHHGKLRKL
jgi:hypothetical protein